MAANLKEDLDHLSNLEDDDVQLDQLEAVLLEIAEEESKNTEQKAPPEADPFNAINFLFDVLHVRKDHLRENLSCASFLEPNDPDFDHIIEYVNNSQEPKHNFGIGILSIIKIKQKRQHHGNLRPEILSNCMMLWHGSPHWSIDLILRYGMQAPDPLSKQKSLQGNGIYFADRVTKSAQYCDPKLQPKHGDNGFLFLCDVALGKTYIAEEANHDFICAPEGFHSVTCEGRQIPLNSGCEFPSGKSVRNRRKEGQGFLVEYNEYVVYDPDQIEIKYLVYFTFESNSYAN